MYNNLIIKVVAALAFSLPVVSHAQILNAFNFDGHNNDGSASTTNAVGTHPASLALGSGLSFNTSFNNGYAVSPDGPDNLAQAETDGRYLALTIKPANGFQANLSSIDIDVASFGGATDFALTDSSNHVFSTSSVNNSDGANYNETTNLTFGSGVTISAPTTFRFYLYGNQLTDPSGDAGHPYVLVFNSGGNNNSFTVNGTASSVPEPTTLALGLAGAFALVTMALRRRSLSSR